LHDNTNSTRNLDALRIIAACAVVILHYSDYVKDTQVGQFMVAHTWHFNLFVDLFFVVSGFVIASQYLGRVGDPLSIGRFLWRRLARIYPLHLATLAFYVALALALHFGIARTDNAARYPFSDLPAQLLLLHAIDGARLTFNFPSWSLSAEMFCYVLFPVIAITVTRNKTLIIALVVLPALGNSVYAAVTGSGSWADWINKGGAFRALPAFNLGIACYLFRDRIARWPVIPGAVTALLATFILAGSWLPEMANLVVIYAIAGLAIQSDCTGRGTLLTTFGFDRWSSLTYSCYMLHIPVATIVLTLGARNLAPQLPGGRLTLVPVAIVVLAIASHASLRWFETPMRRYLNDAFDRRIGTRRPAAVSASPDARR
jgi:peptidoglycan/LPS O-acetylase OafA/YrhL